MSECLGHYSTLGVVRTFLPEKLIYEQPLQRRERERERESLSLQGKHVPGRRKSYIKS